MENTINEEHNHKNIELFNRYTNGDELAFDLIVELNKPFFEKRLQKRGVSPEDAKDVIQKTFIKIHRGINNLKDVSKLTYWMNKALKNETISFIRSRNSLKESNKVSLEYLMFDDESGSNGSGRATRDFASDGHDPSSLLEEKDPKELKLSIMSEAINNLKEKDKNIIEFILSDKTYSQISKELNIPEGTVMSRVFYAKKNLKEACKKLLDSREIVF